MEWIEGTELIECIGFMAVIAFTAFMGMPGPIGLSTDAADSAEARGFTISFDSIPNTPWP